MSENVPPPTDDTLPREQSVARLASLARRAGDWFWTAEAARVPVTGRAVLSALRIAHGVYLDLRQGQITLRAMSLVYSTLFALVPLLALSFSVMKGLGIHNQVRPVLANVLAPLGDEGSELVDTIIGFVDNLNLRVLGYLGVALLFYTVIALVHKIESAFNAVWQIRRSRSLTQRFRDYLSVLLVGPVLVFSSFGVMAGLLRTGAAGALLQVRPLALLVDIVSWALPTVLVIIAFSFFYYFIPNTKVRVRSALVGGIVAGLMWNAIGWAFATYIVSLPSYAQIYAGFASPLIFLIWLYLSWATLLIGSSIAFYHQHAENFPNYRGPLQVGQHARETLALAVVRVVGGAFYSGHSLTAAEIAARLGVPPYVVDLALGWLEQNGVVAMTAEKTPRYVPARPWDQCRVEELMHALRRGADDDAATLSRWNPADRQAVDAVIAKYEQSANAALTGMTLKDFSVPTVN